MKKTKNTLFYLNTPVFDYLVYKLVVKTRETFKFDSIAKMKSINSFVFLCQWKTRYVKGRWPDDDDSKQALKSISS